MDTNAGDLFLSKLGILIYFVKNSDFSGHLKNMLVFGLEPYP
jgi:hypothetical protein